MSGFDFLGKGASFPFRAERRTGGISESREHERLQESITQILGTKIGERFMRPDFGSRLQELVFETNDDVLKGLIRHHVFGAIRRWEPRVLVTDVGFDDASEKVDRHVLPVVIHYRIIQTQVPGNMVYPFYRMTGSSSKIGRSGKSPH